MAATTQESGAAAARATRLATTLDEGELPQTRAALTAGEMSAENAAIIADVARRLPDDLTADERAAVERRLVRDARVLSPGKFRRAGRAALEASQRPQAEIDRHHDTALRDEEDASRAASRFTYHENNDGTISGSFTVPTLPGAILIKTIQQMISPRVADGVACALGPSTFSNDPRADALDWAHRRGLALADLLERLPADHLSGKTNATVVVTIDHSQLLDRLNTDPRVGHLDTGEEISPAQARRIACSAGILPVVLGGESLPLDLGRQRRFFTEAQRVTLASVYTECATEGCDRPYAWSELHHEDPWRRGGETNLNLAVPLCGHHHRRIHDPNYEVTIRTDRGGIKTVRLRLRR